MLDTVGDEAEFSIDPAFKAESSLLRQLDGHGFGWTPGVGDGKGGLAC